MSVRSTAVGAPDPAHHPPAHLLHFRARRPRPPSRPKVPGSIMRAGSDDLSAAAAALRTRLPEPLDPLAEIAYNYRWSWTPGGPELFASIDPERWELCAGNPVRLLQEVHPDTLARLAGDAGFLARLAELQQGSRPCWTRARRRPCPHPSVRRLLLRGVRHPRLAAGLLRRPRRARGGHPQGGLRPRAAARRGRADVPPGLLPPAHRRLGLAARVLGRHRPRAQPRASTGSQARRATRRRGSQRCRGYAASE